MSTVSKTKIVNFILMQFETFLALLIISKFLIFCWMQMKGNKALVYSVLIKSTIQYLPLPSMAISQLMSRQ